MLRSFRRAERRGAGGVPPDRAGPGHTACVSACPSFALGMTENAVRDQRSRGLAGAGAAACKEQGRTHSFHDIWCPNVREAAYKLPRQALLAWHTAEFPTHCVPNSLVAGGVVTVSCRHRPPRTRVVLIPSPRPHVPTPRTRSNCRHCVRGQPRAACAQAPQGRLRCRGAEGQNGAGECSECPDKKPCTGTMALAKPAQRHLGLQTTAGRMGAV